MKTYLSSNPVWLKPAESIRALHGKSIVVVEGQQRIPAHVRISDADSHSQHSGLCCVKVWQASIEGISVEWPETDSRLGGSQAHEWEMYLTEDALPLVHPNHEDAEYGELLLEIPEAA